MKENKILSNDYVAGFVDGEGCFALTVRRDVRKERSSKATYVSWKAAFVICLRSDDSEILKEIQKIFKCGSITYSKNTVRFQVSNITDLFDRVVPFFNKNKMFGKKSKDFEMWSKAIAILNKYKILRGTVNIENGKAGFQKVAWSEQDIKEIHEIYTLSSKYKSKRESAKWTNSSLGRE